MKTGLRSGEIFVIFQSDCSLIQARGLPHISTSSGQVLVTKLLSRYLVQIWKFPVTGQLSTAIHDVYQVTSTHFVKTPTQHLPCICIFQLFILLHPPLLDQRDLHHIFVSDVDRLTSDFTSLCLKQNNLRSFTSLSQGL